MVGLVKTLPGTLVLQSKGERQTELERKLGQRMCFFVVRMKSFLYDKQTASAVTIQDKKTAAINMDMQVSLYYGNRVVLQVCVH